MREKKQHYDIIGDVHGRWDKLEALLAKLGYGHDGKSHVHPDGRKAIFLGDLIDPKGDVPNGVREVLVAVKAMCDHGQASCILGNHEMHFCAYHTRDPENKKEYLKPHHKGSKSHKMHLGTHAALEQEEIDSVWLPWIKELPFFIELPGLRVVHACWHDESIKMLGDRRLSDDKFLRACVSKPLKGGEPKKEHAIYRAAEIVCKGVEIPMPPGESFKDHQGTQRYKFRARWWKEEAVELRANKLVFPACTPFSEKDVLAEDVAKLPGYRPQEAPVFFGHYYKPGDSKLEPEAANVCCIDHSAANGGPLVAYRWNGGASITSQHYVTQHELQPTQ